MNVLVTGATGLVGRTVVESLMEEGSTVRAVSRRSSGPADRFGPAGPLPDGVDVVPDSSDLTGIDAIFVHPRAVGAGVDDLVARAAAGGVRRLVVLSAVNVEDDLSRQPSRHRGDRNAEVEAAVVAARSARLEAIVLRCTEFASNTFGTIGAQLRTGNEVRAAFPRATEATIDERDIGEVAARALLHDGVAERLVLTGPQALTLPERVAAVAAATGRRLSFVEVEPTEAARHLLAAGLPEPFVTSYLALQAEREAMPAPVTTDVAGVLGRPARTFAGWARDHAAHFRGPEAGR